MNIISGIYKIVNTKNGKFYIGSAVDMHTRWNRHKNALKNNKHENLHLQRAYNKYGAGAFSYEIIEETKDLLVREQYHLDTLKAYDINIGYNIGKQSSGGDNLTHHPNRDDIIKRIAKTVRERVAKMTPEERKRIWSHGVGDKNPNWKGGISIYHCIDCNVEISYGHTRCMDCSKKGEQNPFFGKHHSDEYKKEASERMIGKTLSEETKEKCRQASVDFYNSEEGERYKIEQSRKMSGENHPLYGIGHTEESCKKMSKSKIDKIANMSIKERYEWNKMRKVRIVKIQDSYYFSLLDAMKHYSKSHTSLRFRCESTNAKWKDYEFIIISEYTPEQDSDMIDKLTKTSLTPILHT